MRIRLIFILFLTSSVCGYSRQKQSSLIKSAGQTLNDRINVPAGYTRVSIAAGSFAEYLRKLKLKPDGSIVHYYNGRAKENNGVYVAVVDMPIGNKDLQQCADVIMHVRAEYLFITHQENKIHFTLTNGFRADYSKWAEGYRMSLTGNKTQWVKKGSADHSFSSFSQYMDVIYTYCGTLSLSKELKDVEYRDIQPGDVLIKGGSPGHAEIVLDVAKNKEGKKLYLLAQSYMPAQEMQVLANPESAALSPWYEMDDRHTNIITPEWTFTIGQLMRFENE